jgi:hypothetical protein
MSHFLKQKYTREHVDGDVAIYLRAKAAALGAEFGEERAVRLLGLDEPNALRDRSPPPGAHEDQLGWPGSWAINTDRFPLAWLASDLHAFATDGVWQSSSHIEDATSDAAAFLESIEHIAPDTEREADENPIERSSATSLANHFDVTPSGALKAILLSSLVRLRIDDDEGADIELSIRDVAQLAGVAEKTVRLNTDRKLPQPLPTHKEPNGRDVYILASDAVAWIERKFGYAPTRIESAPTPKPDTAVQDALRRLRPRNKQAPTAAKALTSELARLAKQICAGKVDAAAIEGSPSLSEAVVRAAKGLSAS